MHTLVLSPKGDRVHVDVIQEQLTRSLNTVTPAVMDELESAVPEYIQCTGDSELHVTTPHSYMMTVANFHRVGQRQCTGGHAPDRGTCK